MNACELTDYWLVNTIIKLNFCPFAKVPYEKGLIRIQHSKNISDLLMLDFFIDELAFLELNLRTDVSTSLLVYHKSKMSFVDFNDFSSLCDDYLANANLTSEYQLVVFHPGFYFKDSIPLDPTNMVGQSPFPTIHLLRNIDIDEAVRDYPDVDLIPERNKAKIKRMFKVIP